jgi:hypothetical protein
MFFASWTALLGGSWRIVTVVFAAAALLAMLSIEREIKEVLGRVSDKKEAPAIPRRTATEPLSSALTRILGAHSESRRLRMSTASLRQAAWVGGPAIVCGTIATAMFVIMAPHPTALAGSLIAIGIFQMFLNSLALLIAVIRSSASAANLARSGEWLDFTSRDAIADLRLVEELVKWRAQDIDTAVYMLRGRRREFRRRVGALRIIGGAVAGAIAWVGISGKIQLFVQKFVSVVSPTVVIVAIAVTFLGALIASVVLGQPEQVLTAQIEALKVARQFVDAT